MQLFFQFKLPNIIADVNTDVMTNKQYKLIFLKYISWWYKGWK